MIEAYRVVLADGYTGYWHVDEAFIDLLVAMTMEAESASLEAREFASMDELEYANDQHTA